MTYEDRHYCPTIALLSFARKVWARTTFPWQSPVALSLYFSLSETVRRSASSRAEPTHLASLTLSIYGSSSS